MINPPIKAIHCRTKRAVRVYGTTPDGMVLVAYNDTNKADVALWCDLEIPPEPEIVAVAAPPAVAWGEWTICGRVRLQRLGVSFDGAKHLQVIYPTEDGGSGWCWRRNGTLLHEQVGYSDRGLARKDCEAFACAHTAPTAT